MSGGNDEHRKARNRHYILREDEEGETNGSTRLALMFPGLSLSLRMRKIAPVVGLATVLGGGGYAYQKTAVVQEVPKKLESLEERIKAVEGAVKELPGLRRQINEIHRDQMEQWMWQAMKEQDEARARYWRRRIDKLNEGESR